MGSGDILQKEVDWEFECGVWERGSGNYGYKKSASGIFLKQVVGLGI